MVSNCRILEIPQLSEAWFAARCGLVTGSKASAVLATGKGKAEAAPRRDLRTQLVTERLTGLPQGDAIYVTDDMRRGRELEPAARSAYEIQTGNMVRQTGLVVHSDLPIACSLDGDVDDLAGIVEIKCPRPAIHIGYVQCGTVPKKHVPQIVHNLLVTGAQWADFVSYAPSLPDHLQTFVVRLVAVDIARELAAYELALRMFLKEVDAEYTALQSRSVSFAEFE